MARKTTKNPSSGGRRRRKSRNVTIDLEATEVGGEAGQDEAAVSKAADEGAETVPDNENAPRDDGEPEARQTEQDSQKGDWRKLLPLGALGEKTVTYAKYGASGLLGGFVALLLYSGLAWLGVAPVPDDGDPAALAGSLNNLETDTARRLADFETRVEGLETRTSGQPSNDAMAGMVARVETLETRMAEIAGLAATALEGAEQAGELAASAQSALNDLAANPVSGEGEAAAQLAALNARLDSLEVSTAQMLEDIQAAGADNPEGVSSSEVLALRQALSSAQAELDAQIAAANEIARAAGSAVAALEEKVNSASGDIANRFARLENEGGSSASPGMERRVAASLALIALERAVNAGKPYGAELELMRSYADAGMLTTMSGIAQAAETGILTRAELTEQFSALAAEIIDANIAESQTGILGETMARVRSIVRVRPTGFVEGDDVAAIVARAEAHLSEGKLAEAIAELDALTGAAAETAQPWVQDAQNRLAAEEVLSMLNVELLSQVPGSESQ